MTTHNLPPSSRTPRPSPPSPPLPWWLDTRARDRQKYHQYLIYGITITAGVFGGLLFCNLVFPVTITDEAKVLCSLFLGVGLWYLSLHTERMVLQIFGMSAGMATGTMIFNVVAEFYIINSHFLILALAVVWNLSFVHVVFFFSRIKRKTGG